MNLKNNNSLRSFSYAARNAPRHRRRREQHDPKGGGKEHHHSIGGKRRAAPGKRRAVLFSPSPSEWWRFPPFSLWVRESCPCPYSSLLHFCLMLCHCLDLCVFCPCPGLCSALRPIHNKICIDDGFLISIGIISPQMQRYGLGGFKMPSDQGSDFNPCQNWVSCVVVSQR